MRNYGSHSIGAINVARGGGIWLGAATLLADVGKALAPLGLWVLGLLAPRVLAGRWYWVSPVTMLASACIPAAVWAAHPPGPCLVLSVAMAALILMRHKNNIRRLVAGTEPRLGERVAEVAGGRPNGGPRVSISRRSEPAFRLRMEGGGR